MAIIVKANVTWYAAMAIAAVAGYLDTGDLKAGIFSGISAGLAYGAGRFVTGLNIGNPFTDAFVRATTHGLVQGAVGAAQGGRFGSAALAGFTSSILGPTPDGGGFSLTNNQLGDVIQSAIVGGTASKIGGGKFANGAMTGAFVQALNHQNQATANEPKVTESYEVLDTRTERRSVPALDAMGVPEIADIPLPGGREVGRWLRRLGGNLETYRQVVNETMNAEYMVTVETRKYAQRIETRSFSRMTLRDGTSTIWVQDSAIVRESIREVVVHSRFGGFMPRTQSISPRYRPECVRVGGTC